MTRSTVCRSRCACSASTACATSGTTRRLRSVLHSPRATSRRCGGSAACGPPEARPGRGARHPTEAPTLRSGGARRAEARPTARGGRRPSCRRAARSPAPCSTPASRAGPAWHHALPHGGVDRQFLAGHRPSEREPEHGVHVLHGRGASPRPPSASGRTSVASVSRIVSVYSWSKAAPPGAGAGSAGRCSRNPRGSARSRRAARRATGRGSCSG
jgi:hypothetical protein